VLLEFDADVNAKDDVGGTPLHTAVVLNHLDIAKRLLKYNADVNAKDHDKRTPLHFAAMRGQLDHVWELLSHGANRYAKNKAGQTPQQVAVEKGHLKVAELLPHNDTENSITEAFCWGWLFGINKSSGA
jgi:ankyrin repeat protein